jgi:hypothetical protein
MARPKTGLGHFRRTAYEREWSGIGQQPEAGSVAQTLRGHANARVTDVVRRVQVALALILSRHQTVR